MKNLIWLIGSGPMSVSYAKVLSDIGTPFKVIGRGQSSAKDFKEKTGIIVIEGGLSKYLETKPEIPKWVIVSTGVEELFNTSKTLIDYGVKDILCEKPGGLNSTQIKNLSEIAINAKANVFLAYNRRFYGSVAKAKEIVVEDGGVTSFSFEFTEWSHVIENIVKADGVLEHLFLNNSSHVADLAFYLGGKPSVLHCNISGGVNWHKCSSIFSGSGKTETNALFSYQANWEAPGRWGVEILTKKHRLYLRPMEKLQIQNIGSVKVEFVEIDESLDLQYKPGLYKQVEAFLNGDISNFITIQEQAEMTNIYNQIAGYQD